ncbi:MAG: glycosyltransferase family 2 protein [Magnetococcales bacterium]|nr:glycosyltransferase family 2 protein [Magnetococcales bacterium]
MKIIVIVPAYNEEDMIGNAVTALLELKDLFISKKMELKVYVVDDGSTDATASRAEAANVDRIISHGVNIGLGAAVRSGLQAAYSDHADIVVKFDADLQHSPGDIIALLEPILNNEADIVYGNRFEKIDYKMPFVRRVGNILFTSLMRRLTSWPLKDSQPGLIALHRNYLERFYLPGDYNYTQQILVDAYKKGMRFAHVSVSFKQRVTGRSFISLKYPFKVLPQIFMVLVSVKPLRIFGPLGLIFFSSGSFIFLFEIIQYFMGMTERPVTHVFLVLGLLMFGLQTIFFGVLAHLIVDSPGRQQ